MRDRATYRQKIAAAGSFSLTVLAVAMGALTAEAAPFRAAILSAWLQPSAIRHRAAICTKAISSRGTSTTVEMSLSYPT